MSTTFSVSNLPKLRYGTTAEVAAAPVTDGTVLVDTSSWRVYVDLGGRRLDLNTPVPVTTAANLPAQADRVPGKLYVALDTWTIYLSDGTSWHALEPWRYVADTELSDSSSSPIANKAVSAALKGKADLSDGTVVLDQLPIATSGSLGVVKIGSGLTVNSAGDVTVQPATAAQLAERVSLRAPVVPYRLNAAVTAALTDDNHLTLTAEQQATAKSVLGVVDLPSGGTEGQLLAATSDSGVYAWVDPASGGSGGEAEAVTLWSGDVPGQVSWASDMKSVTVSHSLSGSPSVVVLDSAGTRVYPTVTALQSAVLLSFGTAMSIPQSSPWTVALFGADGAIASSDAPADIDDAVRAVLPAITEIPAATSAYSLLDADSDANGHSAVYRHSPSAAPTYTLPAVEDDTVLHEITLSVLFSVAVQTCTFQDSSGNTVTPLSTPHIGAGTVVSYLCRYESLLDRWCVMPVVMGTVEA